MKVGDWFVMLLSPEDRQRLFEAAKLTTFAENALFMEWVRRDPWDFVAAKKARDEYLASGKKVKSRVPGYEKGTWSCTKMARDLCPGLASWIYDAVANHTRQLYFSAKTGRIHFLTFTKRLPVCDDLRIRFRERTCRIVAEPQPDGRVFYAALIRLTKDQPPIKAGLLLKSKSEFTRRYIAGLAESGEHPSGGSIIQKKHKGKWEWQLNISRDRYESERERLAEPVEGRRLLVWAPADQACWLRCEVEREGSAPWITEIVADDIISAKIADQKRRQRLGKHYSQSRERHANHGHGRNRAIQCKERFGRRYQNKVTAFIETRSAAIVCVAIRSRCGFIDLEDISKRDSTTLRTGSFPYYKFLSRVQQKAKEAGIVVKMFDGLQMLEALHGKRSGDDGGKRKDGGAAANDRAKPQGQSP